MSADRPIRRFLSRAATTLWALLVAVPCLGQETPQETFSDRLEVQLAEVDVLVTDEEGKILRDLEAGDFVLLVDGEEVPIETFDPPPPPAPAAIGAGEEPTDPAPEVEGPVVRREVVREPANLVIYLDLAFLRAGELKDLAAPLEEFLKGRLTTGDRVTLVAADRAIESMRSLELPLQPLEPVFQELTARVGRGESLRLEYDDLRRTLESGFDDEEFDPLLDRQPNRGQRQLMVRIENLARTAEEEVQASLVQLRFLVSAVAGLPGRKMVLYLGGRMPLDAGGALVRAWQQSFGPRTARRIAAANSDSPTSTVPASSAVDLATVPNLDVPDRGAEFFKELTTLASAQGVIFYPFDASRRDDASALGLDRNNSTLETVTGSSWAFGDTQRAAHQQALGGLAMGTGGRALVNRRDLDALLAALAGQIGGGYVLGFIPPSRDAETTWKLEVRLRGDRQEEEGLDVQHRRFLRHRTTDQEAADRTLSALLLATAQPRPANPLGVEIEPGERLTGDEGERLQLTVRVPFARLALATESTAHSGQLSLFFTAGDLEHGAEPVRKAVLPLRVPNEELLEAFGRRVEYTLEVPLPEAAGAVAVSVRDDFAPDLSTVLLSLVPGGTGDS